MKTKLALLLAVAIGVLKVAHDSGRSKIYFILAMILSISSLATLEYYLIASFMVPILFYVYDTGNFHQANLRSEPKPFKTYWLLDKPIHKASVEMASLFEINPYVRTAEWEKEYAQARGFLSCALISIIFTLPFLLTEYYKGLPVLLWPFCVRYITWGIKQPDGSRGSEWWWICTFLLFFSYSFLFLWSVN